jgi:predicted nuclease of restriction endonuclease-like (RecB) superfamily
MARPTPKPAKKRAASVLPGSYEELLLEVKERIRSAQTRAAVAVNRELVTLYWQIGREILDRQARERWGARVIDRLSADLRAAFPGQRGFSSRNLKYMRALAEAYPDPGFVQQVVAQLPWGHHVVLLDRLKDFREREWYLRRTIQEGWSRNLLLNQLAGGAMRRHGQALTNFERTLPPARSELTRELLKSPYTFDFLSLDEARREQDLERALVVHIRDFLLELGVGFAFVGRQYPLAVGGRDFFLDLVFYHLRLRCFVVIDLKIGEFEPEYAGKMSFYLAAVDDLLRSPDDHPSVGIILCKDRNDVIVEYALRDTGRPMGVATYETRATLPDALRGALPSADQLTAEVEAVTGAPEPPRALLEG